MLQALVNQDLVVRPQSHATHAHTHRGLAIQPSAQQGQEQGLAFSLLNLDSGSCVPQQLSGFGAASLDRGVLQNSAYINAPHDRAAPNSPGKAAPNSPGRQGKAAPHSPAAGVLSLRQSGNAEQLAHSDPNDAQLHAHATDMGHNPAAASRDDSLGARMSASQNPLLLDAAEAVRCADEATQLQALQDLQHQIGFSEGPVLNACLPQVGLPACLASGCNRDAAILSLSVTGRGAPKHGQLPLLPAIAHHTHIPACISAASISCVRCVSCLRGVSSSLPLLNMSSHA